METDEFTVKTNNDGSISQRVNSSKLHLNDKETEPLHDQSALNFSLRLSDEDEETIER